MTRQRNGGLSTQLSNQQALALVYQASGRKSPEKIVIFQALGWRAQIALFALSRSHESERTYLAKQYMRTRLLITEKAFSYGVIWARCNIKRLQLLSNTFLFSSTPDEAYSPIATDCCLYALVDRNKQSQVLILIEFNIIRKYRENK